MKTYEITEYWFNSIKRLNRDQVEHEFNNFYEEGHIIKTFDNKEKALEELKKYESSKMNYDCYHHLYTYYKYELYENEDDENFDFLGEAYDGYYDSNKESDKD